MTGLKYLAVTPLFLSGVAMSDANPFVEYGALGLAFTVVLFLCKHLNRLTELHRQERKELVVTLQAREEQFIKMVEHRIAADNRLSEALEDRKCIAGDQRIKQVTQKAG